MNLPTLHRLIRGACWLLLLGQLAVFLLAQDALVNDWPMQVGTTWTMEPTKNGTSLTVVMTVVKSIPSVGGAVDSTIDYAIQGQVVQTEPYRPDAKGVNRLQGGKGGTNAPVPSIPIIKYPLVSGSAWNWKGTITTGGQTFQGATVLCAMVPETLTTRTGRFRTARVRVDLAVIDPAGKQAFMSGKTMLSGAAITSYHLQN